MNVAETRKGRESCLHFSFFSGLLFQEYRALLP